jgi:hypothetical protein
VTAGKRTGTPEEAATARATRRAERSEQMRSNCGWKKVKRLPAARSAALICSKGPPASSRSVKVAPSKISWS